MCFYYLILFFIIFIQDNDEYLNDCFIRLYFIIFVFLGPFLIFIFLTLFTQGINDYSDRFYYLILLSFEIYLAFFSIFADGPYWDENFEENNLDIY